MIDERYRSRARQVTAFAGTFFRDPLSLRVIRSMTRSDSALPSRLLRHALDPNYIRSAVGITLNKRRYTHATDVFGVNYSVNINDHIGWHIFARGHFDLAPIALGAFFGKCFPGAISIDVGANIGTTSIPLALSGIPTVGVEASAAVVGELATNVSLNSPLPYTIAHIAASSPEHVATGKLVKIFAPLQNAGAWSMNEHWAGATDASRRIELTRTITLDTLIEALGIRDISFVKLDIEGAEHLALEGFQKSLAAQRPPVTFEWRADVFAASDVEQNDPRPLFPSGYQFFSVQAKLVDRKSAALSLQLGPFSIDGNYENVLAIAPDRASSSPECMEFLRTGSATISLAPTLPTLGNGG
jgi:FkbM family methyltransferase